MPAISRRLRPEFCAGLTPIEAEGAGKAGCRSHPQPRAQDKKAHEHSHHRFTRKSPAFPARMVLRFPSCSSRGPGFLAPVIGAMQCIVANLTPASGRQNHTTSPSARTPPVKQRIRVHRIPRPTFVTTRTPLLWVRDKLVDKAVSTETRSGIFFGAGLDHPNQVEIAREIAVLAHRFF